MSRASQLDCQHLRSCALVLTLFLFQKGQGFFPPLPIAALLPRCWRRAYPNFAGWEAEALLDCLRNGERQVCRPVQLALNLLKPCSLG